MRRERNPESGFALLLIFAMASIIAISLYYAMPRVAFEAQRDKEELLIERGEQYKRAIQLYVRKNRRWPAKVEDLESSNGLRFLRHRYTDPMTGKAEWRLVHVTNGVLTDSLVKPLNDKDKKENKGPNDFITELQPVGGGLEQQANANPALRHRPSDQTAPGAPANGGSGGPIPNDAQIAGQTGVPQPTDPNAPPSPPAGFYPAGQVGQGQGLGVAGQIVAGQVQRQIQTGQSSNASPGQPGLGGQGQAQLGQAQPGQRPGVFPSAPSNFQTGGISVFGGIGSGPPTQPQPAQTQQGFTSGGGANGNTGFAAQGSTISGPAAPGQTDASKLIQNILTSPRPGGLNGLQGQQQGQVGGAGIAGVATTFEGEAIKVYNDQENYKKWEFVYDMSKDASITGGQGAVPQATQAPGTPIGQNPAAQSSSFGQTPTGAQPGTGALPGGPIQPK